MKKIVLILIAVMALAGCSKSSRIQSPPKVSELPNGFEFVASAGNGYFEYRAGDYRFLVSSQRQGSAIGGLFESNVFIDIVFIGSK